MDMNGLSPKFMCAIAGSDKDVIKVKYGRDNAEVYGEMISTRLLWALGFGTDRMYAVRVICRGCPASVYGGTPMPSGERLFDPATVERKFAGYEIETFANQAGAGTNSIASIPSLVGPTRTTGCAETAGRFHPAQRLQAEQQRLVCLDQGPRPTPGADVPCAHPFMFIQDLGLTFGRRISSSTRKTT
jgi:hypothetical protein